MMTRLHGHGRPHQGSIGGFVLPAVLLATVVLSVLASAGLRMAADERQAARAIRESGASRFTAEAGIAVVLDELPIDSVASTLDPGDKHDFGWKTLPDSSSFHPTLRRCDDGTLPIYALNVEGRSAESSAGTRTVQIMLTGGGGATGAPLGGGAWPTGAVVVGGEMSVSGTPTFMGPCSDLHSNSSMKLSGTVTTTGGISASVQLMHDAVFISGSDAAVPLESYAAARPIPTLDPAAYCGEADFHFRNGWIVRAATGDSVDLNLGNDSDGWKYQNGSYVTASTDVSPGTVCADRDLKVTTALGSPGSPLRLTLLATGSISITSNAHLAAHRSDGVTIVASGDLSLSAPLVLSSNLGSPTSSELSSPTSSELGSPTSSELGPPTIVGLLYAGSQCRLSGMSIVGQLLCGGLADPIGAEDLIATNRIEGAALVEYACPTGPSLQPLSSRASREVW